MLLKLSKLSLYISVFSIVIVLPSIFFPFIGGKYFFFRACVELALLFLLLWWAFEAPEGAFEARVKRAFRNPLVIAVTIFAIAFLLATVFALDPHAAFWSNYERGEGGFQMLHYYAFFLLLVLALEREEEWQRLMKLSLVAAFLMILYGVGAAYFADPSRSFVLRFVGPYSIDPNVPSTSTFLGRLFSNARFQGSLGNPAYVAPYLLFSIFYALYLWRTSGSKKRALVWYGLGLLGIIVFFVLSGTRGAFLGLAAAVVAFLGYLIFREKRYRRRGAIVLLAVLLAGGALYATRKTPFIQNIPGSRIIDISFSEQTAQTRFWTWGSAWKGFKERPIFGWGPENFTAVFDKYFDPRHFVPGQNTETWFDRAHSVIFDYLAETGSVGFLAYIGMFAIFYRLFFRAARPKEEGAARDRNGAPSLPFLRALLFALPIAYLVQGVVLFDVLPIFLNLLLFLAFTVYFLGQHHARFAPHAS